MKAKTMVKREVKKEETDLDRIQELFPNDNLHLYERDPLSPRKGVLRSKSATLKLQRALSGKSKTESNNTITRRQASTPNGEDVCQRQFIMEGPVQFTIGVQSQARHMFLFQDLLLIAKPRPSGTYKLKEKILISEVWLSDCIDDVCETNKQMENSFVLGWPTTNVVATFSSNRSKHLWKSKLEQLVLQNKEKEGMSLTSISVTYLDPGNKQEYPKVIRITNNHTAADCVRLLLRQLCLQEEDAKEFQLWVRTHKEEAPYPLIGHEYPLSIKMNLIRGLLQRSELDLLNLNHVSTDSKCNFILRRHSQRTNENIYSSPNSGKKFRKPRRQTLINWPFKRQVSKSDSVDSAIPSSPNPVGLVGWSLCNSWTTEGLPAPLKEILNQLYLKGPYTVGIFRKSANARVLRELKEKLNAAGSAKGSHLAEDMSCIESASPVVLASLLKDVLRCFPDCLLQSRLCYDWLNAINQEFDWQIREKFHCLLSKLPSVNLQLLKHLVCVLQRIAQNACENKMSSENLAVCIGPSLLSPTTTNSPLLETEDVSKKVPKVVAYIIDNCQSLFGKECLSLFWDNSRRESCRQDSGTEEEMDALRDVTRSDFNRDDSSIDSLDHDLIGECEPSPKPTCKTKVSLTNLSRDSGLTLSDTQLYTAEEETEESETSSGSDSQKHGGLMYTKSVPHLDLLPIENESQLRTSMGVSIDGSCHDVVLRKKKHLIDTGRSQTLASLPYLPKSTYESSINTPKSADYSGPVKLRDRKLNALYRRQVQSSLEPLQSYSGQPLLQRSASEESLFKSYVDGPCKLQRRPALHRKGRAPSPPGEKRRLPRDCWSTAIYRQPDPQAIWFANHSGTMDWKRSQSTSKIDQIDGIPNDSVPSQVKMASLASADSATQSCGDLHIYENTKNLRYLDSLHSPPSGDYVSYLMNTSKQEPPSYQEALTRRNMLKRINPPLTVQQVTEQMRQEQILQSARARQLYEESLKLYQQKEVPDCVETHHAVPVKINSLDERMCRSSPSSSSHSSNHSVVSKSLSEGSPRTDGSMNMRLRQLPPVHVTDAQIHVRVPKKKVIACQRTWRECPDIPEDLKGGIHWSVAQLRTLFNSQSTCKNNSATPKAKWKPVPPPYRPPPIPKICKGYDHKRCDSLDSMGVEESFV